jgi:two-component system, OmpR family, copper resistance phosphate regulon response regulator CusR
VDSGEEALFILSREVFDIIVLDVMLPGRNGFEVLKILRETNVKTPVIMLTARDSIEDRVQGLDSGADDYLVKPFAFTELVARIRVRLKNVKSEAQVRLSFSDLEMDLLSREVKRAAKKLDLTLKEFEVLEYLIRHRNETVSREMLARDVWKETSRVTPIDNVIDVHIARLRKKVDQEGQKPIIHTVRGVGFILRQET